MMKSKIAETKYKVGRPRLGTEQARLDSLLDDALKLFMRDGYGRTSIAKIAQYAGISTRTIYEHYQNKAELMLASVSRMVESDVTKLQNIPAIHEMSTEAALNAFGEKIMQRVMSPQLISFYRMGVSEAMHIPEISLKMKAIGPLRIQSVIADYLRKQADRTLLPQQDFAKAAALFCEMLIAEPRSKALFGVLEKNWDAKQHIAYVVAVFLRGIVDTKATQ
ncbi:MAG: TetR/AcrR family transcriptional regulator [Methylophilus sp.]|nr:TetR/AcrR family transcriptional regulator [Methylophilus sp.]